MTEDRKNILEKCKVAPLGGYPALRFTNTDIHTALNDANAHADAISKLNEEIDSEITIALMDLSLEAEGLGAPIEYSDRTAPSVKSHPVGDLDEMPDLPWDKWLDKSRAPIFAKAVEKLSTNSDKPVCAYVAAPLTLAGLLMGVENLMMETADENELLPEFLEKCAKITIEHVKLLQDSGAATICLLDPTAMLLGPGRYTQYAGEYSRRVIAEMEVPAILHICGNTAGMLTQMADTGAKALSIDSLVPLAAADKALAGYGDTVIMGNMNPMDIMNGTPQSIEKTVREMKEAMRGRRLYIASSGCDLPINTPMENIRAFIKTYRDA